MKEKNNHFDNLDEKAKLHKENFVEIVFDNVEYNPGDEAQTWFEQFGLVKNKDGKAVVANNIYIRPGILILFLEKPRYRMIPVLLIKGLRRYRENI